MSLVNQLRHRPSLLRGRGVAGLYPLVIPNWSGRTARRTSSISVLSTSHWVDYRNHRIDRSPSSWYFSRPLGRQPTVRGTPETVRGGVAGIEAVRRPETTERIVKTNEACHQRSRPAHSQRAFARGFKARQHSPTAHVPTIPPLGLG